MAEASSWLPAASLRTQMQGLAALGLDLRRIRAAVGPVPEEADALVPQQAYLAMWREAQALYGDEGLPTALAMAIPFGTFGALDYLVGSADSIGGCIASAHLHFAMVASDVGLELQALEDGSRVVQVRGAAGLPVAALEFTLACIFSRLRHLSGGSFEAVRVGLPVSRPTRASVRERLYGQSLAYDFPCAEIVVSALTWNGGCASADPYLHATLEQLSRQLRVRKPVDTALESAVRMRLRGSLAQGRADAHRMAGLLGVSERTLQRRLDEIGRTFTQVVEDFRREEAARLLSDRALPLVDVAARLGYSEQTSFNRAFKRWHGVTPGAWRSAGSGGPRV